MNESIRDGILGPRDVFMRGLRRYIHIFAFLMEVVLF